jgi:hypothetical protein
MSAELTDDWRYVKLTPRQRHLQREMLYVMRLQGGWRTRIGADDHLYVALPDKPIKPGVKRIFRPMRSTMGHFTSWRSQGGGKSRRSFYKVRSPAK